MHVFIDFGGEGGDILVIFAKQITKKKFSLFNFFKHNWQMTQGTVKLIG